MFCLIDYVGLPSVCGASAPPPAGGWITDLEGVSIAALDHAADSDQKHYEAVWYSIQRRAANRFRAAALDSLNKRVLFPTALAEVNTAEKVSPPQLLPVAPATLRGIVLQPATGPYTAMTINALKLRVKTSTITTVYVFDASDGTLLFSQNWPLNPGWNILEPQWTIAPPLNPMFVAYDATTVQAYNAIAAGSLYRRHKDLLRFTGGSLNLSVEPLVENLPPVPSTGGLRVNLNLHCALDALLCPHKHQFVESWTALLAVEIMQQRLNTPRINKFTQVDGEEANRLRTHYEALFKSSLQTAIQNLILPPPDECFSCNPIVRQVYHL